MAPPAADDQVRKSRPTDDVRGTNCDMGGVCNNVSSSVSCLWLLEVTVLYVLPSI
jgi:hypothetical protein